MTFRPDPKPNFAAERLQRKAEQAAVKKAAAKSHSLFYKEVWKRNPHKCFECGVSLPFYDKALAHHILEKRLQKYYSCNLDDPGNGMLLCLTDHDQVRLDISKTPKVKAATEKKYKEYEPFFIKK